MPNKPDQPPAYPAPVHQDAGPYNPSASPAPYNNYQSPPPDGYNNGNAAPLPNGYFSPGQPHYGPPGTQGYYQPTYPPQPYQQGYPAQGYQQGYPPQGYYAQGPDRGYSSSDGICAGLTAALAFCCCADLCLWLI